MNEFEDCILEMEKYAKENYIPIIRKNSKNLLINTINENNCKNILEIGTAIGYSGINILNINKQVLLTTIEKDENRYNYAKLIFARLKAENRVKQYLGDAKIIIEELIRENKKYDLIFLDGPKGQYINYIDKLFELTTANGIVFADNVLFDGLVKSNDFIPHKKRTIVMNLRKYLDKINNKPYTSELIDIEDGVAITRKI